MARDGAFFVAVPTVDHPILIPKNDVAKKRDYWTKIILLA